METLGYGTHLILDGFNADVNSLEEAVITDFLKGLAGLLEPGKNVTPEIRPVEDLPAGFSAALLLPESHATLHTFTEARVLSLQVFSRHGLELTDLNKRLGRTFGVRRFESHISNHSKTMSKDPERRARTLLGDRSYASLRLTEGLPF